jgi:hypothetical protein
MKIRGFGTVVLFSRTMAVDVCLSFNLSSSFFQRVSVSAMYRQIIR